MSPGKGDVHVGVDVGPAVPGEQGLIGYIWPSTRSPTWVPFRVIWSFKHTHAQPPPAHSLYLVCGGVWGSAFLKISPSGSEVQPGSGTLAYTDHPDLCGFVGNAVISQQPLSYPDLIYNCPTS